MKKILLKIFPLIILGILILPMRVEKTSDANQPIMLLAEKVTQDIEVNLGTNHSSEAAYQNNSFEYLSLSKDVFSDENGLRPFPWGGEIFQGKPLFKCLNEGKIGEHSFQITGSTIYDHGALAVPDLEMKPIVKANTFYYVSFWVKYDFRDGYGFRLTQQFFDKPTIYPKYSCFGPWISGTSNGEWKHLGLLVKSPSDAWKGDPVIELWGNGSIVIDEAYFGEVSIKGGNE